MNKANSWIDVLYEDNHLLVVDKPPLLPTMGVAVNEESLIVRVKEYLKQKYDKPGNVYLGVVSRLDAFTSGVIVLARTSKAAARLNAQFQSGSVEKRYLAIVAATVPDKEKWSDYLLKNETQHRMQTVTENHPEWSGAKLASLEFSKLSTEGEFSLVDIRLLTGRKHQIRVQFSSRGFAILGDRKYGSRTRFVSGIALRSYFVSFEHPTLKTRINIVGPVPEKWPFDRVIRHHLKNLPDAGNSPDMC